MLRELGECLLFSCFGIMAAGCCQTESDAPMPPADAVVVSGFGDSKNISFDRRFASFDSSTGVLRVDSLKSAHMFQPIVRSLNLKPNTNYTLSFNYRVENPNMKEHFFHILVRTGANEDILWENEGESAQFKRLEYKFTTPPGGKLYSVQIHARGKFVGELSDFKLVEGFGENLYIATPEARKFCGDLGKIPSGAEDFEVLPPAPSSEKIVNAADFGISENCENFVAKMNAAIAKCREIGASKLVLNKGIYKVANDGEINFSDLKDFIFDGSGSTLVYRKNYGGNFNITNCRRMVFKNLKMDWDWENDPIASLVEVVKIERNGDSYFDAKFLDYENFPNKNSRIAILTGYDMKNSHINAPGLFTRVLELTKGKGITRREWVAPNVLRVYYSKNDLAPFEIGQHFIFAHYYYDMHGFFLRSNEHLSLENVEILSCAGHAFAVAGTQKYWQLKNVKIGIPKGSKARYLSCAGDHLHIAYSAGYFKMLSCDFSGGNDDCLNAHDCSIYAQPVPGEKGKSNVLRTLSKRNVSEFYAGDEIELRNDDYSPTGFVSKIVSVKWPSDGSGMCDIAFEKDIPKPSGNGFVLFNRRYGTKNIIIRDCNFHDTKARAILMLGSDVTIERCRFANLAGMAVKIETGYTFNSWCEGYGADNIVLRDCVFENACMRSSKSGRNCKDIIISSYCKTDPSREKAKFPILTNILFENNTFKNVKGLLAEIHSADNVIFRGNEIYPLAQTDASAGLKEIFLIGNSKNIKIVNNNIVSGNSSSEYAACAEDKSTRSIVFAGNRIVEP